MSEEKKELKKKSAFAKASADKEVKNIELYKKKTEEHLEGWKRAKADLINYKKQSDKDKQELLKFAAAGAIMEILPIYNNMKLAVKHIPKDEQEKDWVVGIMQINKQFKEYLKNLGFEEIKTVGEEFNPELHEAIVCEEKEGVKKDIVFEEVTPGYKMHDRVLIAAKVKVAK